MRRALRDFADAVRDADLAIVYYAGHGLEIEGSNYLVPVDAVLERDIDAYDEAIPLDRLLAVVEPAKRLRMVILDACRDNPFAKRMKQPVASRSLQRGLVMVEPNSPNTLVAFAAKAGSTADDGDAKNSPFTTALVKHLPVPGLDIRKAFGFVRDDVLKVTNYKQEPFIYGSLGGDDVALVPLPPAPKIDPATAARDDYQLDLADQRCRSLGFFPRQISDWLLQRPRPGATRQADRGKCCRAGAARGGAERPSTRPSAAEEATDRGVKDEGRRRGKSRQGGRTGKGR